VREALVLWVDFLPDLQILLKGVLRWVGQSVLLLVWSIS